MTILSGLRRLLMDEDVSYRLGRPWHIPVAPLVVAMFISGLLLPSLYESSGNACIIRFSESDVTSSPLIYESQIVQSAVFSLHIFGLFTTLNCPVRISLVPFDSPDWLDVGFEFLSLTAESFPLVDCSQGLAIDRIFSYPYAYVNSTRVTDHWATGVPQYEMYRPELFWTPFGSEGTWVNEIHISNLTTPVTVGEYLWLDGMKVCLSSSQQSVCTPSSLLLWAEFNWNLTAWDVQTAIWDSLDKTEVLGNTTIYLQVSIPLSLLGHAVVISGLALPVCMVVYRHWQRTVKMRCRQPIEVVEDRPGQ